MDIQRGEKDSFISRTLNWKPAPAPANQPTTDKSTNHPRKAAKSSHCHCCITFLYTFDIECSAIPAPFKARIHFYPFEWSSFFLSLPGLMIVLNRFRSNTLTATVTCIMRPIFFLSIRSRSSVGMLASSQCFWNDSQTTGNVFWSRAKSGDWIQLCVSIWIRFWSARRKFPCCDHTTIVVVSKQQTVGQSQHRASRRCQTIPWVDDDGNWVPWNGVVMKGDFHFLHLAL